MLAFIITQSHTYARVFEKFFFSSIRFGLSHSPKATNNIQYTRGSRSIFPIAQAHFFRQYFSRYARTKSMFWIHNYIFLSRSPSRYLINHQFSFSFASAAACSIEQRLGKPRTNDFGAILLRNYFG